jgi:hypothetical protein
MTEIRPQSLGLAKNSSAGVRAEPYDANASDRIVPVGAGLWRSVSGLAGLRECVRLHLGLVRPLGLRVWSANR